MTDKYVQGLREAKNLAMSIWRTEYMETAPDWEPLTDIAGIISQIDNMYAGVRGQRDALRVENAQLRDQLMQNTVISETEVVNTNKGG